MCARYYFPTVSDAPSLRPLEDVPNAETYEDSLFIAQLRAAGLTQVDSAKVEFYNAEILARDVTAKKDVEELSELASVRTTVHSLWAHRYDQACTSSESDELPGLHAATMAAIESDYQVAPPVRLRSRVVHHFGVAHQLSDVGRLGWVRNFEEVAAKHGS